MFRHLTKILLLLFFFPAYLFSQTVTSSPYSRYGLGDLQSCVSPSFAALGGGVIGVYSNKVINPYNPASYTAYNPNSFLFSTGGQHLTVDMRTDDLSQTTNNTSLSHIVMGFPISSKIGGSAGLIPFSNTGYTLKKRDNINSTDLIYSGDGGVSKIYFGAGYKLTQDLSIGINASYLFGGLNRRKKTNFDDISAFNARSNSRINLKGYFYELGLLYQKSISENQLNIGLRMNNNSNITAKRDILTETFETVGSFEYVKDTIYSTVEKGIAILPRYIGLGISYSKDDKWVFVSDISLQDWESYRLFDESDSLRNSVSFSLGTEYTPDVNSVTSYFKRIQYRFGFSYKNTPIQLNGVQLQSKSVSLGLGLPLRKSRTQYNLFVELGERGTLEENLIKEQFARFGIGVSFNGIWFVKRKYD